MFSGTPPVITPFNTLSVSVSPSEDSDNPRKLALYQMDNVSSDGYTAILSFLQESVQLLQTFLLLSVLMMRTFPNVRITDEAYTDLLTVSYAA